MTSQPDDRSRESKYYHNRKARGDHLLRIWADKETAERFRELCGDLTIEYVFKQMVDKAVAP